MNVKTCAFLDVMGNVKEIPFFGRQMDEYVFPISLFIMVVFTATDAYNRILGWLGKGSSYVAASESEREQKIIDGQYIVDKFRKDHFTSRFSDGQKKSKRWSVKLEDTLMEHDDQASTANSENESPSNHAFISGDSRKSQEISKKAINKALQNMEEIEKIQKLL